MKPEKTITCRKCRQTSGNSWGQCNGKCPLPQSPHYKQETATKYAPKGKAQ